MAKHQSFSVESDEAALADLHRRLRETRWPGEPREADWRYGTNLGYLKRLVDYWLHDYDWAMAIDRINGFQQFIADASLGSDTLDLHFIREPGSGSGRLPLLLLHGWPGSIAEFLDFIPPLAYPDRFGGEADDGFEVIAPSLPGFAFSEAPPAPTGPRAVARLLLRFMTETLGHERFYIQGGDWGAIIGTQMAVIAPEAVAALHVNAVPVRPYLGPGSQRLTEEEQDWLKAARAVRSHETGYQAIQGTRGQTLAYGLTDSPVGLAAWIVEKFQRWSDPDAPKPPFSPDQLLTNIMLYWLTGTINTSTWLYRGIREEGSFALEAVEGVRPPMALCLPPNDLFPPPPKSWIGRLGNVVRDTRLEAGGHFTALENGPELLTDLRAFFRNYR
ncbi:MAG: alpha/beta fold hydrolase [Alphaproteobacteria bacterium]|jgi:microsomal epoxide hydrolase|nr:alpha/beta fold hydrolase [Alphaproteobacteria bacterium]|tara:strand:+ start:1065 stop:2228 length:1164 start_codon:yes stop_codon:yes gene_type:complete